MMGQWKWKLWIIAWASSDWGTWTIDMERETWRGWRRVCGRLYWSNPLINPTRHMGQFWAHSSLAWLDDIRKDGWG